MGKAIAASLVAAGVLAAPAPKASVLRLHDLPSGFKTLSARTYNLAAAAKRNQQSVSQLRSWGFLTAFEADFARKVTPTKSLKGAIEVQSAVSAYKADTGAKLSLARAISPCGRPPSRELRAGVPIGDEVHVCANVATSNGLRYQAYAVLWRRGSQRGSLFVVGIKGGITAGQAIALARKQDARMK